MSNKNYVQISHIDTLKAIVDGTEEDGVILDMGGYDASIVGTATTEHGVRLYSFMWSDDAGIHHWSNHPFVTFLEETNIMQFFKKHALGDSKVSLVLNSTIKGIKVNPIIGQNRFRVLRERGGSMLRVTSSGAISSRYENRTLRFCNDCMVDLHLGNCCVSFIDEQNDLDEQYELFGKICFNCKSPLADWSQCKFCREVWWDGCDSHSCDGIRIKEYRDPDWFSFNDFTVAHFHTDPIPD